MPAQHEESAKAARRVCSLARCAVLRRRRGRGQAGRQAGGMCRCFGEGVERARAEKSWPQRAQKWARSPCLFPFFFFLSSPPFSAAWFSAAPEAGAASAHTALLLCGRPWPLARLAGPCRPLLLALKGAGSDESCCGQWRRLLCADDESSGGAALLLLLLTAARSAAAVGTGMRARRGDAAMLAEGEGGGRGGRRKGREKQQGEVLRDQLSLEKRRETDLGHRRRPCWCAVEARVRRGCGCG